MNNKHCSTPNEKTQTNITPNHNPNPNPTDNHKRNCTDDYELVNNIIESVDSITGDDLNSPS